MLDQNTDRMWYVIGAVIIGAAIIFIMTNTFPQLFASVGETFQKKTDEVAGVVDGITSNTEATDGIGPITKGVVVLEPEDLELRDADILSYDAASHTWDLTMHPTLEWMNSGFRIVSSRFAVPYGSTMRISYEVYIPSTLTDMISTIDVNNHTIEGPGHGWDTVAETANDNDNRPLRIHNGDTENLRHRKLVSGSWNTIWATYVNSSEGNLEKEDLYDNSQFGIRNNTGGNLNVQIRNVTVQMTE